MKRKGNYSSSKVVKTIIRLISTPFASHTNVCAEVPTPNETVNRFPTTFVFDHLQFFNPENNPSLQSIAETIPYRPVEAASSYSTYPSNEFRHGLETYPQSKVKYPKGNVVKNNWKRRGKMDAKSLSKRKAKSH